MQRHSLDCSLNKMGFWVCAHRKGFFKTFKKPPRGGLQMKSVELGNT